MLSLDFRNTSAGTLYLISGGEMCMIVHCYYRLAMYQVDLRTAKRDNADNTIWNDYLNSQIFFFCVNVYKLRYAVV